MNTVNVIVDGGPTVTVGWVSGMNAQQALEAAFNQINNSQQFTYAMQYYGTQLGYMVIMINETYDSFISSAAPYFYWALLYNGNPATTGIDGLILNAGDTVEFNFTTYVPGASGQGVLLDAKYQLQQRAKG